MPKYENEVKLCVLGSGAVGKSCVTLQMVMNKFVPEYDPTIEDSYRKQTNVDGTPYLMEILDTAGQDELSVLRDQYIQECQGFVLVYSVLARLSFEEACALRERILLVKDSDKVPMVFLGNKTDIAAADPSQREVTRMEGQQMANAWGVPFFETSALLNQNIKEAFQQCVREVARGKEGSIEPLKKKKQSSRCTLL